ncbi:hypothetical protein C8F01DRAFT_1370725 [Mycena amicta]|nr:hypothetical protein C8F01DRAFT_1370725 [Mycena amicta]
MMPELAVEIWLEIAQILPRNVLANLSLTNRRFRALSKALLFAHFKFHPYARRTESFIPRWHEEPRIPDALGLRQTLERLEFWYSDAIAPLVRTCLVSPWDEAQVGPVQGWTFSSSPTPLILLEAFFQVLHRFARLQGLSLHHIDFRYTTFLTSCSALYLEHLEVYNCEVFPSATLAIGDNRRVKKFSLRETRTTRDERSLALWLAGFDRDALQELQLRCKLPSPRWPESGLVFGTVFANVGVLSLSMGVTEVAEGLRFLACFSDLVSLTIALPGLIYSWKFELPPLTGNLRFLKLKMLDAPGELLPVFLGMGVAPSLGELSVRSITSNSLVSRLRPTLAPTFTTTTISSLVLELTACDGGGNDHKLEQVLEFFPLLETLRVMLFCYVGRWRVNAEESVNSLPMEFFAGLPKIRSLCASLVALTISWEFGYDSFDAWPEHNASKTKLVKIKEALLQRCPGLKRLRLDGDMFTYRWQAGGGRGEFR